MALWAALLLLDRAWLARRRGSPARPLPLLAAAVIGTASHALLDATNSYGFRPFLPWDGRWVFLDLWSVIDPWLWLLFGAAIFLTAPRRARAAVVLAPLAAAIGWLLALVPGTPAAAAAVWAAGIGVVVLVSLRTRRAAAGPGPARAALAIAGVYAALTFASSRLALARLEGSPAAAEARAEETSATVAALPRPADPLRWDGFVATRATLRHRVIGAAAALDPFGPGFDRWERRLDDPRVAALGRSCPGAVLMDFFRFPVASFERNDGGGERIVLRDARFGLREKGWATFTAGLGEDGLPVVDGIPCPGGAARAALSARAACLTAGSPPASPDRGR